MSKGSEKIEPRVARSTPRLVILNRSELALDQERIRKWLDVDDIGVFEESLKEKGQQKPLIVVPIPGSSRYKVADGVGTVVAGDNVNIGQYIAIVVEGMREEEAYLIANSMRWEPDPGILAGRIASLKAATGCSDKDLAKLMRCGRTKVTKTKQIATLPPEVLGEINSLEQPPKAGVLAELAYCSDQALRGKLVELGHRLIKPHPNPDCSQFH